jgi:hypothetical protein
MVRIFMLTCCVFALACHNSQAILAQPQQLEWAPSPPDNPLKGLVPYENPPQGRFPHSMEFQYVPLSKLMIGPDRFDWEPLEALLDRVAARGHQTIFRIWMEYPGRKVGIPAFLEEEGMKVTEWLCTNTDPFPRQMVRTPDYSDPRLHAALRSFILALGERYDGDARIGYITAGLLGTWGEWHSYPREDLYPTKEIQNVVMDAYTEAFPQTPVLLRYPAGGDNFHYAANHQRPFGYHDDSFAWATLDTGRPEDDWYFLPAMKAAGALEKWKSQPIGGEIRPELWDSMFTDRPHSQGQDFDQSVQQTHVTWLMDTGMFRKDAPEERRRRAIEAVRKMGYDVQVMTLDRQADEASKSVRLELTVRNLGVAPFYANWPIELAAFDTSGDVVQRWPTQWSLRGLLPGDDDRRWVATVDTSMLQQPDLQLALRVVNPLPNGVPLRFANKSQDQHAPGWLSLGAVNRNR